MREGLEKKIGKIIYGIEEELNCEYQIQETFYYNDLEKNNGNKENYNFTPLQEFRKMTLIQKKMCINEMKKQSYNRDLEASYDKYRENFEVIFREKDFMKAQQKNIIHYPMAYIRPLFETSAFKCEKDVDYFIEKLLLIDENVKMPAFNLRTFYNIPREYDMFDFKTILKWRGLENIVLDDENLDALKFCEIMSMAREKDNYIRNDFMDVWSHFM